jgi:hypothetical protein
MARIEQNSNGKGSLRDLQILINEFPNLLNQLLVNEIIELQNDKIYWLSPLHNDNYSEYLDSAFINLLNVPLSKKLSDFWPSGGPHWDALGKSDNGIVFLIEAKANIPEIVSPGTKAKEKSKIIIDKSLKETKTYLKIENEIDWSGKYYQYTNRLAHLYFLRVLNNVPTYLINIYFINDSSVNGPKSKTEWLEGLEILKSYLGIGYHILSKYMIDIFIDVEDFKR